MSISTFTSNAAITNTNALLEAVSKASDTIIDAAKMKQELLHNWVGGNLEFELVWSFLNTVTQTSLSTVSQISDNLSPV